MSVPSLDVVFAAVVVADDADVVVVAVVDCSLAVYLTHRDCSLASAMSICPSCATPPPQCRALTQASKSSAYSLFPTKFPNTNTLTTRTFNP